MRNIVAHFAQTDAPIIAAAKAIDWVDKLVPSSVWRFRRLGLATQLKDTQDAGL